MSDRSPDELELEELRQRITVLEGHRNQWRKIAFRLSDLVKSGDLEGAQAYAREALE